MSGRKRIKGFGNSIKDRLVFSLRFLFRKKSEGYFTNKLYSQVKNIGTNVRVMGPVWISDPREVIIGSGVLFEGRNKLYSSGGIIIGNNAVINSGLEILSSDREFLLENSDFRSVKQLHHQLVPAVVKNDIPDVESELTTGTNIQEKLFFLVSTGRSGTNAFAKNINKHSQVACVHEPFFAFNRLSTQLAHGMLKKNEVSDELKLLYQDCSVFPSKNHFGQSDLKNGNLISVIHAEVPKAKFIWMIRDPEGFVASAYARGWFDEREYGKLKQGEFSFDTIVNPGIFDQYRWDYSVFRIHGVLCGEFTEEEWSKMGCFERCCWYWYYWNQLIEDQLRNIPSSLWIKLKLSELDAEMNTVQQFLGLPVENLTVEKTNQATYTVYSKSNWTPEQMSLFEKWCRKGIERWL